MYLIYRLSKFPSYLALERNSRFEIFSRIGGKYDVNELLVDRACAVTGSD